MRQTTRTSGIFVILTASVALAGPPTAEWLPESGDWLDGSNWQGRPGVGTVSVFDGGPATVWFSGVAYCGGITVHQSQASFSMGPYGLVLTPGSGASGNLRIAAAHGAVLTLEQGDLVVDGLTEIGLGGDDGWLYVGQNESADFYGNGINIDNGTLLVGLHGRVLGAYANVGVNGGSALSVQGELGLDGDLVAGIGQVGEVFLNSGVSTVGGTVTRGQDGGTGSMSVTNNASLTVGGNILTGVGGPGALEIISGGHVHSTGDHLIGNGAPGEVLVSGAGSQLSTDGHLQVGSGNYGSLTVQYGGQVTSSGAGPAIWGPNGAGDVLITGAGSKWSSFDFAAGYASGPGIVTLADGGELEVETYMAIGWTDTGGGSVALDGGVLDVGGALDIGREGSGGITTSGLPSEVTAGQTISLGLAPTGQGIVVLAEGATMSTPELVVADQGIGEFTVNGAAVTTDALTIGRTGFGQLHVNAGGSVDVTGAFIVGELDGAVATTTVAGASATISAGEATIGQGDGAILYVNDGGAVSVADSMRVGLQPSGNSAVHLAAGVLSVGGDLEVGGTGNGDIHTNPDAPSQINVGGAFTLGKGESGNGDLFLYPGSTLTASELIVGSEGVGHLYVLGGSFDVGSLIIAEHPSAGFCDVELEGTSTGHLIDATLGADAPSFLFLRDDSELFIEETLTIGPVGAVSLDDSSHLACQSLELGVGVPALPFASFNVHTTTTSAEILGRATCGPAASLDVEVDGVTAPLAIGELVADGVLGVSFVEGLVPRAGDTIPVIAAGGVSGAFDYVFAGPLSEGLGAGVVFDDSGVAIEIFETCDGDEHADGAVDVLDLILVLVNWGTCDSFPFPCEGDINGDEEVDVQDLVAVIAAWGEC